MRLIFNLINIYWIECIHFSRDSMNEKYREQILSLCEFHRSQYCPNIPWKYHYDGFFSCNGSSSIIAYICQVYFFPIVWHYICSMVSSINWKSLCHILFFLFFVHNILRIVLFFLCVFLHVRCRRRITELTYFVLYDFVAGILMQCVGIIRRKLFDVNVRLNIFFSWSDTSNMNHWITFSTEFFSTNE